MSSNKHGAHAPPAKQQFLVARGRDGDEAAPHQGLLHELENVS